MRPFPFLVAAFVAFLASAVSASDGAAGYAGRWKQVSSSAGACATCTLAIERGHREFRIEANTGWTATVSLVESEGGRKALSLQGIGQWSAAIKGAMAGRKFRIALSNDDGVLRMLMLLRTPGNRPPQRIAAEFILDASD